MGRRLIHGTSAALAAVLLLSACAPGAPQEPPTTPTASQAQETAFPAVYSQELDWQRCGGDEEAADRLEDRLRAAGGRIDGMQCTLVDAPLDWTAPETDTTIQLRVVRIPATGDEPIGSLLSNPGGPGASGLELALGMAVSPAFAPLHEAYDLIGLDPRGIGESTPLECETTSAIMELRLAECAEQNRLAASMGSAQVARDLELLRHLLGDETLHYLGLSYGTVIGASYVTLFPERVGRVLLDSAWPSNWSSPLGAYLQQEAIAQANIDMLERCGLVYEVDVCPARDEATLLERLAQLDAEPLVAADGTEVDRAAFLGYLTTGLYQQVSGRTAALETAGRAISGEQDAIDAIAEAMRAGGSSVGLSGMVVRCLSAPRDPGIMELYRYITDHGLPELMGGPEITDETLKPWLDLSCDALPDSGEDYLAFANDSDEPVLVFGITGDHATPYDGAQRLVAELGNARLVTLEGSGHIATYTGRSTCADDIATAFLLRAELPAEGTVCRDD